MSWARPSHTLITPRLTLRTALPSDSPAFTHLFSDPRNNPFGGVVGHLKSEEEQRENLSKQSGPDGSTARGENAWLVVILSSPPRSSEVLRTSDGLLIGSAGFNEFRLADDERGYGEGKDGKEEKELSTDIGCLIDWRFQRRGFALEVLQATIEYAFGTLRVKRVTAGTHITNLPWRWMMGVLGFPDGVVKKDGRPDEEGDSITYSFREEDWEKSREKLKRRGKWYLD